MKNLVFIIALITMVGGTAFAQGNWEDNIGVYFNADGTVVSNNDGVAGVHHVYMVLTNVTSPTVDGFECKITAEGGMIISYASKVFPLETINVGTRYGEVIAGFGSPLATVNGNAMVMEFDIIITDPGMPGLLYIAPVYFPSIPGAPAYLSAGEIVAAKNSTGPGMPVLVTNIPEEPVATETTSFDNLKSLYR